MKQTRFARITSQIITVTLMVLFLQTSFPIQSFAARQDGDLSTSTGLNWDNPNNGKNPYKFNVKDYLNSDLIMQVVGCTGVVDKISSAVTGLFQKNMKAKMAEIKRDAYRKVCKGTENAAGMAAGLIPQVTTSPVVLSQIECGEINATKDDKALDELIAIREAAEKEDKTEQCLNGIAYTLARNQLTAMTKYTMNWVATGFNGDPMYVREANQFMQSLSNGIVKKETELFGDIKNYPYSLNFSRSYIKNYKAMGEDLYARTRSDILNYLEEGKEVEDFANDFSVGGWDAWLAVTQYPQNNPLGYTMIKSQDIADQIAKEQQQKLNELNSSGGFFNQKKCINYETPEETAKNRYNSEKLKQGLGSVFPTFDEWVKKNYPGGFGENTEVCVAWENMTPGAVIKDKISSTLNSPERQLELADTINESLNILFSSLLTKFQNEGLTSLASNNTDFGGSNRGGSGSNSVFTDVESGLSYSNNSYSNGSFDITQDLGNKYIHDYKEKSVGDWNAQTNEPKLYSNGLVGEEMVIPNTYYTVKIAGTTKLIKNDSNSWDVGDRAFWDGIKWQNWKCGPTSPSTRNCTPQTNPIKSKGVLQNQNDFVAIGKEVLMSLPGIMPKIGELDYCIPGPNPSWEANSGDTYGNFITYIYSLGSEYKDGAFLKRDSSEFRIAKKGDSEFDNYKLNFEDTSTSWWTNITKMQLWKDLLLHGNVGNVKKDKKEDALLYEINNLLTKIPSELEMFTLDYGEIVLNTYGSKSLMQSQFLEREDLYTRDKNTAWLPSAEPALNITKDILGYDEDTKEVYENYKEAIIQANSNIYKLDDIRKKVNGIIKEAQTARDNKVMDMFGITLAEYKEKYKDCLAEEEITYYDDADVLTTVGTEDRCIDGLDNDLDGLVDDKDPDCISSTTAQVNTPVPIVELHHFLYDDEDSVNYYNVTWYSENTESCEIQFNPYQDIEVDNDTSGSITVPKNIEVFVTCYNEDRSKKVTKTIKTGVDADPTPPR